MRTPVVKKVARKKRVEKKQSKPVVEKKVELVSENPLLASALEKINQNQTLIIESLKLQMEAIQMGSHQPPIEWVFDIIKDDHGNLKQIRAKQEKHVTTIN